MNKQHLTLPEVALAVGWSIPSLYHHLSKLPPRTPVGKWRFWTTEDIPVIKAALERVRAGNVTTWKVTPEMRKEFVDLRRCGFTLSEIGRLFGVRDTTVGYWLRKLAPHLL